MELILTTENIVGNKSRIVVTYNLTNILQVGNHVLIDDGLIGMKVIAIEGNDVKCVLINSGFLGHYK